MWLAFIGLLALLTRRPSAVWAASDLVPFKYLPLDLGQVMPSGWMKDQLDVQVAGLSGHLHDFFHYVVNNTWEGGGSTYSDLQEAAPYWYNAAVPMAILSRSEHLWDQANTFLTYVLEHVTEDGWIGPEPRWLWGRWYFMQGAILHTQVDSSRVPTVVSAFHAFNNLTLSMLSNNGNGLYDGGWGACRIQEYQFVLQWLYDHYPEGNEARLLEAMGSIQHWGAVASRSYSGRVGTWEEYYTDGIFPTDGVTPSTATQFTHGVNTAMALKEGAIAYRYTRNQTYLDSTYKRIGLLYQYHGRPSGVYAADEHMAGLQPYRGSELCLVVEEMYSFTYLYQLWGDNDFADRAERLAYNALPGTLTGDMWSHQYLQQANQIWARDMSNNNPFVLDSGYSNVFGLEPNYPCCTVNHPQGYPKLIAAAILANADNTSLVHVYLGPYSVSTTLASGNAITVVSSSGYPFDEVIDYAFTADAPFTFYVRIPGWASSAGEGTYSVNGGGENPISASVDNATALLPLSVPAGRSIARVALGARTVLEPTVNGSTAVIRGALHYALDIPFNKTQIAVSSAEPRAIDWQFLPASTWNVAIDPSTLSFVSTYSGSLWSPVFESGGPPVHYTAKACEIAWASSGSWGATSGPPPANAICLGDAFNVTLVPYGAAKLRMGELSVVSF